MKSFTQLEVEAGKQKEGGRSKGTEINGIEALPTVRRPDIHNMDKLCLMKEKQKGIYYNDSIYI